MKRVPLDWAATQNKALRLIRGELPNRHADVLACLITRGDDLAGTPTQIVVDVSQSEQPSPTSWPKRIRDKNHEDRYRA